MGRVHDHEPLDSLAVQVRRRPGDHAAPVVPDDHRALAAERRDQRLDVAGERAEVVRPARAGAAVAAQVGRDGAVAGRRERRQLVAPRPAELGEAVQEQDERPVLRSFGERGEAEPAGLDDHGKARCSTAPLAVSPGLGPPAIA